MKFVAPEQAPEQAEIIRNTPFWPDVDLSEFRSVMRTDGTVTQPRLKQVALVCRHGDMALRGCMTAAAIFRAGSLASSVKTGLKLSTARQM